MTTDFRQGDLLIRTGIDLPHLGVFAGRVYEVEAFEAQHPEGLFLKGWIEGFDPLNFRPRIRRWRPRAWQPKV